MTRLSDVLGGADELPLAELCAARIDGDLSMFGAAYVPLDAVVDVQLRVRVARLGAPNDSVVAGMTAAWVYGAVPALPARRTLCFAHGQVKRIPSSVDFLVRDVRLSESEILHLPGGAITEPLRTMIDIARYEGLDRAPTLIARLALCTGHATVDIEALRATYAEKRPYPHQRRIVEALDAARLTVAHAVDVVDGVDAAHGVENAVEMARIAHLKHETADREAVA